MCKRSFFLPHVNHPPSLITLAGLPAKTMAKRWKRLMQQSLLREHTFFFRYLPYIRAPLPEIQQSSPTLTWVKIPP